MKSATAEHFVLLVNVTLELPLLALPARTALVRTRYGFFKKKNAKKNSLEFPFGSFFFHLPVSLDSLFFQLFLLPIAATKSVM